MRLPFDISSNSFQDDARIKFSFTSPELNQNIEISIDGTKISVDVLLETFERFMGALGVSIPEDVVLGFIRVEDDGEDGEDDDEDDDDDDDDGGGGSEVEFVSDEDAPSTGSKKGKKK